jgi:hypothetical protein
MIYRFIPPFLNSKGRKIDAVDMPDDAENEYAEEIKRRKETPTPDDKPKRAKKVNTNI